MELPEHIIQVAWEAFCASEERHDDYPTALADAISTAAPLIIANAYRRTAPNAICGDDYNLLIDLASELDGRAS